MFWFELDWLGLVAAALATDLSSSFSIIFYDARFVIFYPKLALPPTSVSKCVTFGKKLRTYEMLPNSQHGNHRLLHQFSDETLSLHECSRLLFLEI